MPPPSLLASCRRLPAVRPLLLRAAARPACPRRACFASASRDPAPPQSPPPLQQALHAAAVMDAPTRAVIEAIHATPTKAVVYLAGGGAQARPGSAAAAVARPPPPLRLGA
jgi:hypothetical protein